MMNDKLTGTLLIAVGTIGLLLKIIEPLFLVKGCFGYGWIDYLVNAISIWIPILLIVIGVKKYRKIDKDMELSSKK